MDTATLTALLGWTAVFNIGFLLFTTLAIITCRQWIAGIHAKMFNVDEESLGELYFKYIAQYKILVITFNIAPYLALRMVS